MINIVQFRAAVVALTMLAFVLCLCVVNCVATFSTLQPGNAFASIAIVGVFITSIVLLLVSPTLCFMRIGVSLFNRLYLFLVSMFIFALRSKAASASRTINMHMRKGTDDQNILREVNIAYFPRLLPYTEFERVVGLVPTAIELGVFWLKRRI